LETACGRGMQTGDRSKRSPQRLFRSQESIRKEIPERVEMEATSSSAFDRVTTSRSRKSTCRNVARTRSVAALSINRSTKRVWLGIQPSLNPRRTTAMYRLENRLSSTCSDFFRPRFAKAFSAANAARAGSEYTRFARPPSQRPLAAMRVGGVDRPPVRAWYPDFASDVIPTRVGSGLRSPSTARLPGCQPSLSRCRLRFAILAASTNPPPADRCPNNAASGARATPPGSCCFERPCITAWRAG